VLVIHYFKLCVVRILVIEFIPGPESKKHGSPHTSQSKCRLCGLQITDKFRLHRGRKFCSQACLRKYGSSMEQPESPRRPAADDYGFATDQSQNELRHPLQVAYQPQQEMVKILHALTADV